MSEPRSAPRLPGRYIIHRHVASPLTCRHKYRCACHPQPAAPKPENLSAKVEQAVNAKLDLHVIEVAGLVARALETFPDAREAVDRTISEFRSRHNL